MLGKYAQHTDYDILTYKVESEPLRVTKNNETIIITSEQGTISIPTNEIKSFESKICASNISLTSFGYWVTVSHELRIETNTDILSFIYPVPWYSYYKTDYKEVFQLIDLNIPNYKCTLIGDIAHINDDIKYYLKHKKRLSFIKRSERLLCKYLFKYVYISASCKTSSSIQST